MPVKAGAPTASPDPPLLSVYIALDPRLMTEITIEMDAAGRRLLSTEGNAPGIRLARWDEAFLDALLRLVRLGGVPDGHGGPWRCAAARALLCHPQGRGRPVRPPCLCPGQRHRALHRRSVVKAG
ncbi:AraC family transcriptional regulator N-terminal domain-containing protein [Aquicoccus sp. SU-CL01552]|uniref:AraC family transcriptional regulator N-terminal domain-containing protein n=1 Tax=Aquicoccus sp. SU-CL01552 TaxID=3127656 RepID=UPI003340C661